MIDNIDLAPFLHSFERRELVLNLWQIGFDGPKIAKLLGLSSRGAVNRMVSVARLGGDERAHSRIGPGRPSRPRYPRAAVASHMEYHERKERVLALWELGVVSKEIARQVGLQSRGGVVRIVRNARRDGDPRAQRRRC